MTDRTVKVSLIIDDKGSVKLLRQTADEGGHTESKLKKLDKSVKGLGSSFGGLKGMIGLGFGALTGGALAFGIKDIASKTNELADETEKFHSISGIGATGSLRYVAALKARGIGGEAAGKAFRFLAKNIQTAERQENSFAVAQAKASAKGKVATTLLGVQAEGFKRLGISLGQFNKLTEEQKLEEVTKKFEKMAPGVDKTRLAVQLFGRGGTSLLPVLEKNNLGLTHQLALVKKFFPEIKGGAKGLDELREKQAESKMAWEGLEFTIGQKLVPTMTSLMGTFSEVVVEVEKGKGVWGELRGDIEGVVSAGKGVVGFLSNLGKTFKIPVGAGGLGAALMAFAGIHTLKHPVKATKTAASLSKKIVKPLLEHPYLVPAAAAAGVGASIPFVSSIGIRAGAEKISPGYLKNHSLAEIQRSFLGGQREDRTGKQGYGNTRLEGKAAGGVSSHEASIVSRLLEHPNKINQKTIGGLTPAEIGAIMAAAQKGEQSAKLDVHLDSTKIAEALIRNPRARRAIAESTTIYAQGMTARK